MEKRTRRFLWGSFVCMVVVCIVVFVSLTYFMSQKTNESIQEISQIYMEEVNTQLRQKFASIAGLRLEQVEGIVARVPADAFDSNEDMIDELILCAEVRNFTYLGFYTPEGGLIKILGNEVSIADNDNVLMHLQNNGEMVGQGVDEAGNKFLLLGKAASYPMGDGNQSMALVAGLSMDYLNTALYLDETEGRVYSHIIDDEGYFVIRNGSAYRKSYYERIAEEYSEYNGKSVKDYAQELREAIVSNQIFCDTIILEGEERMIYCSPISGNTSWYLISAMRTQILDEAITKLDKVRLRIMLCSSLAILLVMLFIFIRYFALSRKQMIEINEARETAVKANKAKSDFLSSMSHDIRTPMNAIIGMTEIALKNIGDSLKTEDCLKKVLLSSKHLLALINDVLDMSKIESGKMTLNMHRVSLREAMGDIVNIMQPQVKAKKQYFDILIKDVLSEDVYCDGVRLNQILVNLLSNAVKFTPEEGKIDVHMYQEASPKGGEYVRTHFIVEDNGIGMSKEFQQKIWDTFARDDREQVQKTTGTGLGTSIVRKIVDLMGGEIELTSELDKGSKFHITLDLRRAEEIEEMKLPSWRLLVVDDNELLCASAVSSLTELGVSAEWALGGNQAIKMVEEHHTKGEDYDFVLVDWKMPHMNGLETIHEIRKRVGKGIPVFLISAYDWSDIEDEAGKVEIEGFISKPLFKSTLYTCLKHYADNMETSDNEDVNEVIDFTGAKVLVAEDIDINWEIAEEVLSAYGFELDRAENGKICVEMFEKSEPGYYSVILMDIRMPVMDGYDATRAIRALDRTDRYLPIVAMTADAFEDDVQYCISCGMNAHVAKPLDIKELIRVLHKFIHGEEME